MHDNRQPRPKRRRLAAALVAVVGAGAIASFGGVVYGRQMVRDRLEAAATAAGLALSVDGIDISPSGRVTIEKLAFARADGSSVVAADRIVAEISPVAAARGSRRPENVVVSGLLVDVRVVDGRPDELLDLYRAVRARKKPSAPAKKRKRPKTSTALRVDGGEIRLHVVGKGAELMPEGLAVKGLQVTFDPDRGVGDVAAVVEGTHTSKLQAKMHPATADKPAWVDARMTPELKIGLPNTNPLARWIDAVVVRGFGYDGVAGPSVNGIELHRGGKKLVEVQRVAPNDSRVLAVRADGITIDLPAGLFGAKAAPPGGPRRMATPKGKSRGKGEGKTRAKRRVRDRRHKRRYRGRKGRRRAHSKSRASAKVKTARKAPAPKPKTRARRSLAERLRDLPAIKGSIGAVTIGTDAPSIAGPLFVDVDNVAVQIGANIASIGTRSASLEVVDPRRGLKQSIRGLTIDGPFADLVFNLETMKRLPFGEKLHRAVADARRGRVARKLAADEEGDAEQADAPPEAAPKRKRRRGPRKAYTLGFIKPIRKAHRELLGVPARLEAVVARLSAVDNLELNVTNGRLGLKDPVAPDAFAGIDKIAVKLTRTLTDGTRGLDASAEPFADAKPLGTLQVDLTTTAKGKLDRLVTKASGGSFARLVAAVGATASVQEDAELGFEATLKRTQAGGVTVDAKLSSKHIGINWWRLAPRPIDDFQFSADVQLRVMPSPDSIAVDMREFKVGDATSKVLFELNDLAPAKATARLLIELPKQDCANVAAAIPKSMLPTIGGIEAEGEIAMTFDMSMPLHLPYKGKLEATLEDSECEVTSFGEIDVTDLAKPFSRPVNESGTILEDQLIGPKSQAWVNLADLQPWVPYAMIATEDAAFYHHRGVRLGLLSRAIKMCLDHGRFVYGGSTITQQLVKNIYLTRDKNLARKFEELLIVWQIERGLLAAKDLDDDDRYVATKDRLLELYINGIEFGPKLYGITRAARAYFDKEPTELSPLEVAFLAANKPCPKCGHKRFTERKWTPWWQERMVSIMSKMRRDEIITDDQFAAEAPYVPRFVGWEGSAQKVAGSRIGGVEE